jgi:hypothetical protein
MGGVFQNDVSIYIGAADTVGSAVASATNKIVGEISNFSIGGLDQENDYKQLFGGQLEIEKPRSNGTVTFDVSVSNVATSAFDRWDLYQFPTGLSSEETANKCIVIAAISNGIWKTIAINNARITSLETEHSADGELTKSVTFSFAATTPLGVANLKTSTLAPSTSYWSWA